MNKKLLMKAAGYAAAPKLTFLMSNPRKAALAKAGKWVAGRVIPDRLMPARKRAHPGKTALKGLGAAAVALPLGVWLGRKVLGRGGAEA